MGGAPRPALFVSTVFDMVDVDHALGCEMRRRGWEVRWIVSREESAADLRVRGAASAEIVSLSIRRSDVRQSLVRSRDDDVAESLVAALGKTGDPYRFLMVDRFAARWSGRARLHYAGLLAARIRAAFSAVTDFVVAGEPSSLADWFMHLHARQRGQLFCSLHTVRYPSGNVGCFAGIDDATLLPLENGSDASAPPTLESVLESRPSYFALDTGNMGRRSLLEWPARLWTLYRNSDEAADFSLLERAKRRAGMALNRQYLGRVFPFDAPHGGRPYVLFPLQVQPEMVVDVCNPEFRDQLRTIAVIRRLLPPNYDVYVKEHHSQLGCRGRTFYRALRNLPDVRVVSPELDGKALARAAAAVVSVSGTMLLEAAMCGVPAIALSPVFFGVHRFVRTVVTVDDLATVLRELPADRPDSATVRVANEAYLEWVAQRSRSAQYGELTHHPDLLDPANVRVLADVLSQGIEAGRLAMRS